MASDSAWFAYLDREYLKDLEEESEEESDD